MKFLMLMQKKYRLIITYLTCFTFGVKIKKNKLKNQILGTRSKRTKELELRKKRLVLTLLYNSLSKKMFLKLVKHKRFHSHPTMAMFL